MKWIPLSERKPEINQRVLVYQKGGVHGGCEIDIDYLDELGDWSEQGVYCSISHWMPLPTFDETEKPEDPDWEKLENSFNNWNWLSHGKVSTAEVIENMYYFLKAKYDK